ncbi:MAG: epoxide hydrolase [Caulobacteraceae bacterium]|nr:epoxide hydrolase [Caulobacteraceae bacterium]
MSSVVPFEVAISDPQVQDLRRRLELTRLPERETVDDWSQGAPLAYVRSLLTYWRDGYDMKRLEPRLNAFPQFMTHIDDLDIHFIHVRSAEAGARPLLLTHGWPGSVVEFLNAIPMLVDPVRHGGKSSDAFHVICPSLPGYGFSAKPSRAGWGVARIAKAFAELMARLRYDSYFAQGGDWGSAVTSAIALHDPQHCRAIHLNMVAAQPTAEQLQSPTEAEKRALERLAYYRDWDSGYSKEQSTRPQTIGYSLTDSPAGLLAWIVEKFWSWTDSDGDPLKVLGKDQILDNVMVYWLNAAGASSARLYWESFRDFSSGEVTTPTGVSLFPREIIQTSRRWAENRYKNITYWNAVERGGHFAAFEQPILFTEELRRFFAQI